MKLGNWIDRPSFGIPYTYAVTGYVLAEALRAQGREPESQKIMQDVRDVAVAAKITDVISAMDN